MRYWVRNAGAGCFELWEIRLSGGQFSDRCVGAVTVEALAALDAEQAQRYVVATFGMPLPDDFVPME